MYSKIEFRKMIDKIVDNYGVSSYVNNLTDGMTEDEINEDLWFMSPCCDDPILYDDWADDLEDLIDRKYLECPIAES